jgi:hypothetical protein
MQITDTNHIRSIVKSLVIHHGHLVEAHRTKPSLSLLVACFCLRLAVDALNSFVTE